MTQPTKFNLITDFIDELFEELNIQTEKEESQALRKVLEERIASRIFLNIVQSLTPEQAALVTKDLTSDNPNPDLVLGSLIHNLPHLQTVIAQTLGEIHIELINDFKNVSIL